MINRKELPRHKASKNSIQLVFVNFRISVVTSTGCRNLDLDLD